MKKIAILFLALILFGGSQVFANRDTDLETHKHSIVYLKHVYEINGEEKISNGTGFFIDHNHVITASHAIHSKSEAKDKYIRLYFQESLDYQTNVDATVIYDDTINDVAILKVVDSALSFIMDKVEPLQISNETLKINDELTIIGFPNDPVKETNFSFVNVIKYESIFSVSKGTLEGDFKEDGHQQQMIATNKVRGGYSGSPVLGANGHVVGLARAKVDITEEVVFVPLDILIKDIQDSKI